MLASPTLTEVSLDGGVLFSLMCSLQTLGQRVQGSLQRLRGAAAF